MLDTSTSVSRHKYLLLAWLAIDVDVAELPRHISSGDEAVQQVGGDVYSREHAENRSSSAIINDPRVDDRC